MFEVGDLVILTGEVGNLDSEFELVRAWNLFKHHCIENFEVAQITYIFEDQAPPSAKCYKIKFLNQEVDDAFIALGGNVKTFSAPDDEFRSMHAIYLRRATPLEIIASRAKLLKP